MKKSKIQIFISCGLLFFSYTFSSLSKARYTRTPLSSYDQAFNPIQMDQSGLSYAYMQKNTSLNNKVNKQTSIQTQNTESKKIETETSTSQSEKTNSNQLQSTPNKNPNTEEAQKIENSKITQVQDTNESGSLKRTKNDTPEVTKTQTAHTETESITEQGSQNSNTTPDENNTSHQRSTEEIKEESDSNPDFFEDYDIDLAHNRQKLSRKYQNATKNTVKEENEENDSDNKKEEILSQKQSSEEKDFSETDDFNSTPLSKKSFYGQTSSQSQLLNTEEGMSRDSQDLEAITSDDAGFMGIKRYYNLAANRLKYGWNSLLGKDTKEEYLKNRVKIGLKYNTPDGKYNAENQKFQSKLDEYNNKTQLEIDNKRTRELIKKYDQGETLEDNELAKVREYKLHENVVKYNKGEISKNDFLKNKVEISEEFNPSYKRYADENKQLLQEYSKHMEKEALNPQIQSQFSDKEIADMRYKALENNESLYKRSKGSFGIDEERYLENRVKISEKLNTRDGSFANQNQEFRNEYEKYMNKGKIKTLKKISQDKKEITQSQKSLNKESDFEKDDLDDIEADA